jgi:predicted Zn-dependent peptidase
MIKSIIIEPINKLLKMSYVAIYVEGGTILDSKPGLSHLIEHLRFNTMKDGQYLFDAYNIQADFNAYTDIDHVCYHITVPNENLFKAINLLVRIINKFKTNIHKIIDENRIVLQEQLIHNDNPSIWLCDKSYENIFKNHPLEKSCLDIPLKVPYYNIAEISEHEKKFYNNNNLTLSICSSISKSKILKKIEKIKFKNNDSPDIYKPSPFIVNINGKKPIYFTYSKKYSKTYIFIDIQIPHDPNINLKTILTRQLLVYLLGNSNISELFSYLRLKKKFIYNINSSYNATIYYSSISINLSVSKKNINNSIQGVIAVLNNIKNGNFEIAFNTHKLNGIDQFIEDSNTDNSSLETAIYSIYRAYNIKTNYTEMLNIYKNIELTDIKEEAKKIFIIDSRCSIHMTK